MRKYRADDFWFEISQGPALSGGHSVRYYLVRCCRCDATTSYHASGVANEGLRKIFKRKGWDIGKARNLHICPECQRKRDRLIVEHHVDEDARARARTRLDLNEPPTRVMQMRALWDQCSAEERSEFCAWLFKQSPPLSEFQHGTHIDSMPVERPPPPLQHAPAVITEENEPAAEGESEGEDEGEVADWWKKIQEEKTT